MEPASAPVPLVRGARGAVVAPHHLATAAGLGVLADGGSAVDAIIATNAVLGVVAPTTCGAGGDAFWLVWDERPGRLHALNGSGRAPMAADPDALRARGWTQIPLRGPASIMTPGAVRSWGDAHRRWGRLPLDRVLGPAIELAWRGFPIWPELRTAIEKAAAAIPDEPWAAGFHAVYRPHGRAWRDGEVLRLPALAGTLERLAREGTDDAYDGALGDRQASFLASVGAPFAVEDLRALQSRWDEPVVATYRDVRVATHPPNSAGFVALELLSALAAVGAPAGAFTVTGWDDPAWIHAGLELGKRVLADRDRWLVDPDRGTVPLEDLLGAAHAAELAAAFDPERADPAPAPVVTLVGGTAFLAAVDAEGNAVSLIQSNASGFGSWVVDPETGIHYQNRGSSFQLDPEHPNALEPGRRTAHSLLPAMLFRAGESRPWVVLGSMGGDLQPLIVAQLVSALVDGGADVATAVAAPRWGVEPAGRGGPPLDVQVEQGMGSAVLAGLEARGHRTRMLDRFANGIGHAHAIELVDGGPAAGGSLAAATDPRCAGLPAAR